MHLKCESSGLYNFSAKQGVRYVQVPFMTGFTVPGGIASLLSTENEPVSTPAYLPRPRHVACCLGEAEQAFCSSQGIYMSCILKPWLSDVIRILKLRAGTATTRIREELAPHK